MRKVKGHIYIQAPVQTVRTIAGSAAGGWMVARGGLLRPGGRATWDATELAEGGTRFTLQLEYRSRLAFLEALTADRLRKSVAQSLSRLKQLAERG